MVTVKRRVEVFTAGCPVCTEVVGLVRAIACPSCEVRVYGLRDGCATNECRGKATRYGLTAVHAVALSVAIGCEPCIRAYVQMAHEKVITQAELIEFLEVAMTMQGCPGEEWALKAYAAYKECISGNEQVSAALCCAH